MTAEYHLHPGTQGSQHELSPVMTGQLVARQDAATRAFWSVNLTAPSMQLGEQQLSCPVLQKNKFFLSCFLAKHGC